MTGRPAALLWLAFASGAVVLAIEVVALRSMMLVATMSFYAPAALLETVVVVLAASPWLALRMRAKGSAWTPEGMALVVGAIALCASPLIYWQLVQSGNWLAGAATLNGSLARMALLTLAFVGPPVLLYVGQLSADQAPAQVSNSLDNLTLELAAGRTRLTHDGPQQYLAGQRWNDHLRDVLRRTRANTAIPQAVRDAARLGFLLTNWDIARRIKDPAEPAIARDVRKALAPILQADPAADLQQWPGPVEWLRPVD